MKIKSHTFFAYGPECEHARRVLSDGAFKAYMYIAAHVQRSTGRMPYQARDLAVKVQKSLRAMNTYADEMAEKGICNFRPALNQYELGEVEVCDIAWPYVKETNVQKPKELETYRFQIREAMRMRPCILCRFSAADSSFAERIFLRGISLVQITRALTLGCAAKYISLLKDPGTGTISRLNYFADVIEKVAKPLSDFQNWPLLTMVMMKYEIGWCVTYLGLAITTFKLTTIEAEEVLKLRINEISNFSHERKLRVLTEDQAARISCVARIFNAAEHSRGRIDSDWFATPNSSHFFGGRRPLDRMSTDSLEELDSICKHIRTLAGY